MFRSGNIFTFFDEGEGEKEPVKESVKVTSESEDDSMDDINYEVLGQPTTIDEFGIYGKEIEEAGKWFADFQKSIADRKGGAGTKATKVPRILMIMGKKGCGKTLLAKLLFKKFNYDMYDVKNNLEILNANHKSITNKQLVEQFHNVISYKNLNEYKSEATSYGLLFDDIECMIETGDTSIFNEMVSLVKAAMKPEPAAGGSGGVSGGSKSKSGKKSGGGSCTKKSGSKPNIMELMEAASSDPAIVAARKAYKEPRLYNPIICTCNYTNDKKMTELKKLCKIIDLGIPSYAQYSAVFDRLLAMNGIKMGGGDSGGNASTRLADQRSAASSRESSTFMGSRRDPEGCRESSDVAALREDLFEHFEYDIRKIYEFVDNVRRLSSYQGVVDRKIVDLYKLIYTKADLHCQINDATMRILSTSLDVEESTILYYMDTLSIPLMVHHNMLDYVEEMGISMGKSGGMGMGTGGAIEGVDFGTQFDAYMGGLRSLCEYDQTQTLTYKYHSWDLLPAMAAFQSVYVPNLHFRKLGKMGGLEKERQKIKIAFTNILNKISQLEVNRKMIQNAYFSANRLMIDDDELIYVIEIFLNLLQIPHGRKEKSDDGDEDGDNGEIIESGEGGGSGAEAEIKVDDSLLLCARSLDRANRVDPSPTLSPTKKKGTGSAASAASKEPYTLDKSPYKRIIEIMNHYNIDIPSLEIILKIEKLNIFENKNPKRFTAKIRDELEKFVTAQASQYDMGDAE